MHMLPRGFGVSRRRRGKNHFSIFLSLHHYSKHFDFKILLAYREGLVISPDGGWGGAWGGLRTVIGACGCGSGVVWKRGVGQVLWRNGPEWRSFDNILRLCHNGLAGGERRTTKRRALANGSLTME